jgi:hypothetical protein
VRAADEASAIEELLLTNELFRVNDVALRKVVINRLWRRSLAAGALPRWPPTVPDHRAVE